MRIFRVAIFATRGKSMKSNVKKIWPYFENKAAPKIAFFLVMHNARITLRPLVG
ncbi:MAG: hypothetical protein WCD79_20515 [Chthoniobacteraceae bacterium]